MGVSNGVIIYAAKDGNDRKVFAAKEWIAPMCSHVPNHGVQMVKYCGWCSNVLRGKGITIFKVLAGGSRCQRGLNMLYIPPTGHPTGIHLSKYYTKPGFN
jgi:hypothetical protein